MKRNLLPLLAVLLLAACTSKSNKTESTAGDASAEKKGSFDLSAARQAIEANNQQFGKAFSSGDSAAIVALYHSQAVVYPPNMPSGDRMLMGSIAKAIPGMGIKSTSLQTTDVMGNEDMVVETGTYEMSDGSKALDKGKYMVVWKMEDGRWKFFRDIWNSDMPPPPGK